MAMSEYMRSLRAAVGHRLLELPAVTILVRDDRGRVLLVRQSDPEIWSTPGGAIEPYEVPADAALREVWEETGLEVKLTRMVGAFGGPDFVTRYGNGDLVSTGKMSDVASSLPSAFVVVAADCCSISRNLSCKPAGPPTSTNPITNTSRHPPIITEHWTTSV